MSFQIIFPQIIYKSLDVFIFIKWNIFLLLLGRFFDVIFKLKHDNFYKACVKKSKESIMINQEYFCFKVAQLL